MHLVVVENSTRVLVHLSLGRDAHVMSRVRSIEVNRLGSHLVEESLSRGVDGQVLCTQRHLVPCDRESILRSIDSSVVWIHYPQLSLHLPFILFSWQILVLLRLGLRQLSEPVEANLLCGLHEMLHVVIQIPWLFDRLYRFILVDFGLFSSHKGGSLSGGRVPFVEDTRVKKKVSLGHNLLVRIALIHRLRRYVDLGQLSDSTVDVLQGHVFALVGPTAFHSRVLGCDLLHVQHIVKANGRDLVTCLVAATSCQVGQELRTCPDLEAFLLVVCHGSIITALHAVSLLGHSLTIPILSGCIQHETRIDRTRSKRFLLLEVVDKASRSQDVLVQLVDSLVPDLTSVARIYLVYAHRHHNAAVTVRSEHRVQRVSAHYAGLEN